MSACIVKWCLALACEGSEYCAIHTNHPVYRQAENARAHQAYKRWKREQRVKEQHAERKAWDREAAERIRERLKQRREGR
jgi:hypothetical protein